MLFRIWEVATVLAIVAVLTLTKHLPIFAGLPLAELSGIVSFSFAILLSLRIYNAELARIRAGE